MKRILTAIVLIALVAALIFFGKMWMVTIAAALVAGLAAMEFRGFAESGGCPIPLWWTISAVALFFLATFFRPLDTITVVAFVTLVLFAVAAFRMSLERVLLQTAVGLLMLVYIAYPLTLIPQILNEENGTALLLFLFVCVWSGDIAALYIGKRFGRHKFSPLLSPNKTWEGAVASIVASCVFGMSLILLGDWLTQQNSSFMRLHTSERLVGVPDPGCHAQRGGAIWRPFGVSAQARRRGEGLRYHAAGARGYSRPDRRLAGCSAGSVVCHRAA